MNIQLWKNGIMLTTISREEALKLLFEKKAIRINEQAVEIV